MNQYSRFLNGMWCIELKPIDHKRPKAALCKNYTKDMSCWFKYPNVPDRYGILLKPNNLIVVDIDKPGEISIDEFPKTFTVMSGGGGWHLYGSNDYHQGPFKNPSWGDIKTDGHVVGPGVINEHGSMYQIYRNGPIQSFRPDLFTTLQHGGADGGRHRVVNPLHYPNIITTETEIIEFLVTQPKVMDRLQHMDYGDRSGNDYLIAKCLTDKGIHPDIVKSFLKKYGSSKIRERGPNYISFTVRNAQRDSQNKLYIEPLTIYNQNGRDVKWNEKEDETIQSNFRKEPPQLLEVLAQIESGDKYYIVSKKKGSRGIFYSLDSGWIQQSFDGNHTVPGPATQFLSIPQDVDVIEQLCAGLQRIVNGTPRSKAETVEAPMEEKTIKAKKHN